jgi:hypothetical protein
VIYCIETTSQNLVVGGWHAQPGLLKVTWNDDEPTGLRGWQSVAS